MLMEVYEVTTGVCFESTLWVQFSVVLHDLEFIYLSISITDMLCPTEPCSGS